MRPSTVRDTHLDCVKGALIVLVVFGHLLERVLASSALFGALFAAIYLFHMPAFVVIGGMFAKALPTGQDYKRIATGLLLPLLVFQCIYLLPHLIVKGVFISPALQPYWILWFLLSMALWRLSLPLFAQLPFALPLSIALALMAGMDNDIGYAFSLSRTLYFFPFFIVGFMYRSHIDALARSSRGLLVMAFFGAAGVIVYWSFHGLDHTVLFGSKSYALASVWPAYPATGRALLMLLSLVATLGFFAIIPRSGVWLAMVGQRTLTIFLLHGFFVSAAARVAPSVSMPTGLLFVVLMMLTVAIVTMLTVLGPWIDTAALQVRDKLTAIARSLKKRDT